MGTMSMGGIGIGVTVISTPQVGTGETALQYNSFCKSYWHPGVFLKLDKPNSDIDNIEQFGSGLILTTNRALRVKKPYAGSNGWLTTGTTGDLSDSTYTGCPEVEVAGPTGNRQPKLSNGTYALAKYPPISCKTSENKQIIKYRKTFSGNEPIRGRWFYSDKWTQYCHDYSATDGYLDVNFTSNQTNVLTIKKITQNKPVLSNGVLTVNPYPTNATVTFPNNVSGSVIFDNNIMIPTLEGVVHYKVTLEGYQTIETNISINGLKSIDVILKKEETLTINTIPEDAIVHFDTPGTVVGNTITVLTGTRVTGTVTSNGFVTKSFEKTVWESGYLSIKLDPIIYNTLTVNPIPDDASVAITATGYTQEGHSITVEKGTTVYYSVSKPSYIPVTSTPHTVNSDQTIEITLSDHELTEATLTVIPHPADSLISFSTGSVHGYTTTVAPNISLEFTLSKRDYITTTFPVTVPSNMSITAIIKPESILTNPTLYIRTDPADAEITFITPGIIDGKSITVPAGTLVRYTVSRVGYISQTFMHLVNETEFINAPKIEKQNFMITAVTNPADALVTFSTGTVSGHTCTVPYNTQVTLFASKDGYYDSDPITVTVTTNTNVPVPDLVMKLVKLTVQTVPEDANVFLLAEGFPQEGKSIEVPPGTLVSYTVSRDKLETKTGTINVDKEKTETIQLKYPSGTILFDSASPGTYNLPLLVPTDVEIFIVGAGGGASHYQVPYKG